MLSPRYAFTVLIVAVMGSIIPPAGAQGLYTVDTQPPRGFMPTSDQLTSPVDSVDTANGKLHMQIPLGSLPHTRGGFGFAADLVYDSHLYNIASAVQPGIPPFPDNPPFRNFQRIDSQALSGGWSYNFNNIRLETEEAEGVCESAPNVQRQFRSRIFLPDGSAHILQPRGGTFPFGVAEGFLSITPDGGTLWCGGTRGQSVSGWVTFLTADGSYLKLEVHATGNDFGPHTWVLYFPDGRRVVHMGGEFTSFQNCDVGLGNLCLFDANGNRIRIVQYQDGSGLHTSISDDGGRTVQIDYRFQVISDTFRQDRVTSTGPNGSITWAIDYKFLQLGDGQRQYQVTYDAPSTGQTEAIDFAFWTVTDVQLPTGPIVDLGTAPSPSTSYTFKYDGDSRNIHVGTGELNFMQTPSGSVYTYAWKNDSCIAPCGLDAVKMVHDNSVTSRTISHDSAVDTWTYSIGNVAGSSVVTNPDGGQTTYQYYVDGNWRQNLVFEIDEPNGAVHQRTWAQNMPYGLQCCRTQGNPYIQREGVTPGAGATRKTAITDYNYDKNGNILQRTEYDWVDFSSNFSFGTLTTRRAESVSYYIAAPAASNTTDFSLAYWQPNTNFTGLSVGDPRRLNATYIRSVSPDGNFNNSYTATYFSYDNYLTRGNVTSEQRWKSDSPGTPNTANVVNWTRAYDTYGNLTDIYEPSDNGEPNRRTHVEYNTIPDYPSDVYYGYGSTSQRHWQYAWNNSAGVINSKTDTDNNIATTYSYDNVGRQRTSDEAGRRQVLTQYDDAHLKVTVKRDLKSHLDGLLQTATHYDQLGRVRLVRTSDGTALDPNLETDGVKVTTAHLMLPGGACVVTSTPYRSLNDPTLEWNRTQYDQLGRVTTVATFNGSQPGCQSTNWTGITQFQYDVDTGTGLARTRTIDPANKTRDEERDALGRLSRVVENPAGLNYVTVYAYDPLDNLSTVLQAGQTRSFTYDSLSRLRGAANPETNPYWTTYTYYASGDLYQRTDPRNLTTTFTYDELHRVRTKTYPTGSGTPNATYTYYLTGSSAPNVGQLQQVSSAAASTVYNGYDGLGHVTSSTHSINGLGGTYPFGYQWYLNDALSQITYPSGRVVNYEVDDAGRVDWVYGTSPSNKTYADMRNPTTGITTPYAADGRLGQLRLGNSLYETREYHTPGTATVYELGTAASGRDRLRLEYDFSGTANNGNVIGHRIINNGATWSQTFEYDGVNRLTTAWENNVKQVYGYDTSGNRWVDPNQSTWTIQTADIHEPTALTNFDPSTNRLTNPSYDAAGNQTSYAPYNLTYDAENRNISVTSANNGNMTFAYDAGGQRVMKAWTPGGGATTSTYYLYDALGQLAAEYANQSVAPATVYPFTDMLGSVRAVTDASGSLAECYDYLPFGRYLVQADHQRPSCYPGTVQPASRLAEKFTGKQRDSETGLDFLETRYFSAAQGRFTSPDGVFAGQHASNPQSWNMYSYALNNPLRFVDPNGDDPCENGVNPETGNICTVVTAADPSWSRRFLRAIGSFFKGAGEEATVNTVIDTVNTIETMRQMHFGNLVPGLDLRQPRIQPATSAEQYGQYAGMIASFFVPGGGEEKAGAKIIGTVGFSGKAVATAAKDLEAGATAVRVGSKSEAEELFLRLFQGRGYRNTTGWEAGEVKDFFNTKRGTYHWDPAHGPEMPHPDLPHVQIHTPEGPIIRIFYGPKD